MTNKPALIRMSPETRAKAESQAKKLGLNLSEYVRLLINLDIKINILSKNIEAE